MKNEQCKNEKWKLYVVCCSLPAGRQGYQLSAFSLQPI